jgi:uncharacterized tellurite resistance protein B-like protein
MLDRISAFLSGGSNKNSASGRITSEKQVAAAALLIEVAVMDDQFEAVERSRIGELVAKYFDLDGKACDVLIQEAEAAARDSGQLYEFTRVINDNYSPEENVELMELLWEVVYADGEVHDMETGLLRQIGGLIYVSDRDRGLTRKRVAQRVSDSGS